MQSIKLYNPNSSNLHLTSLASTYSLSDTVNPFNYQLATDDFLALVQVDGQVLYSLDPATTTAMFWVLHHLARFIVQAVLHNLHSDPSIPFALKGYIPQSYFNHICMRRPDILTIQDHHFPNLLNGFTTRENLAAWYHKFQAVGRLTVQWIQTAKCQTLQLGPGTGWDWEMWKAPISNSQTGILSPAASQFTALWTTWILVPTLFPSGWKEVQEIQVMKDCWRNMKRVERGMSCCIPLNLLTPDATPFSIPSWKISLLTMGMLMTVIFSAKPWSSTLPSPPIRTTPT